MKRSDLDSLIDANQFERINQVQVISDVKPSTFEDAADWYDYASSDHFWIQWRLAAFLRFLDDLQVQRNFSYRVLDVGCGAGILRSQLESQTEWIIDGVDLNMNALQRVPAGRGSIYYYDIRDERKELEGGYDLVILFDVLEHIENTTPFLESLLYHLKPGGYVLVNVPSLQGFFSLYDEVVGHVRRYNKMSLAREFENIGLESPKTRYWGFSMLPMLALRKLRFQLKKMPPHAILQKGLMPPGEYIHKLLRSIMRLETMILGKPPLGTSLLLAAQKKK